MNHTVLIVDSDPVFRLHLKFSLQEAGFIVHLAQNEQEVFAVLAKVAIDLLLVDAKLLEANGSMLCSTLCTSCKAPVIIMASSRSPEDMLVALVAGADDYVTKPFSFAAVTVCIQKQLKGARSRIHSGYTPYLAHGETGARQYTRSTCG